MPLLVILLIAGMVLLFLPKHSEQTPAQTPTQSNSPQTPSPPSSVDKVRDFYNKLKSKGYIASSVSYEDFKDTFEKVKTLTDSTVSTSLMLGIIAHESRFNRKAKNVNIEKNEYSVGLCQLNAYVETPVTAWIQAMYLGYGNSKTQNVIQANAPTNNDIVEICRETIEGKETVLYDKNFNVALAITYVDFIKKNRLSGVENYEKICYYYNAGVNADPDNFTKWKQGSGARYLKEVKEVIDLYRSTF